MIALAEHKLLLIKLNLPSSTPRVRNPVRGSPGLTLAQVNAVQRICIMWMQKGHSFFWRDVERAAKRRYAVLSFCICLLAYLTDSGVLHFLCGSQNSRCAPRSNNNDCSRARREQELHLDRTTRNGMSLSNEMFAAFLYFCSNIPVFSLRKNCS